MMYSMHVYPPCSKEILWKGDTFSLTRSLVLNQVHRKNSSNKKRPKNILTQSFYSEKLNAKDTIFSTKITTSVQEKSEDSFWSLIHQTVQTQLRSWPQIKHAIY